MEWFKIVTVVDGRIVKVFKEFAGRAEALAYAAELGNVLYVAVDDLLVMDQKQFAEYILALD